MEKWGKMKILKNDPYGFLDEIEEEMREATTMCLEGEGIDPQNIEVSVSIVSLDEIHELNKNYRNVDSATDVLSFPLIEDFEQLDEELEEVMLGDVVICKDKIIEQAEEFGHSVKREILYLFVHSMLHLLGYDHMNEAEKKEMRFLEEDIMDKLNLGRA